MAFPPKTQREQAMLLVGMIAIGLVAAYWNFVYKPKAAELVVLQERVDTLETRNARAKVEAGYSLQRTGPVVAQLFADLLREAA